MEFYVTNLSNIDIHLSDLGLVVRSKTTINIFGKKSIITKDQLIKSCLYGSIKKRIENKTLVIRLSAPKIEKKKIEVANKFLNSRVKTAIVYEPTTNEELDLLYKSDRNLADEEMIKEILNSED